MNPRLPVLAWLVFGTSCVGASACGHAARCPDDARLVERRALGDEGTETFCLSRTLRHPRVGIYERRTSAGVTIERGEYGPDGRRRGTWRRFWENGRRRWVAEYRDGRQHGAWEAWHSNAKRSSKGAFEDGKKHGAWTRWRSDGQIASTGGYRHGLRHGQWREYHPNGRLAGEGRYVAGQRVRWRVFRRDGRAQAGPEPKIASAEVCWQVVQRACRVLIPRECATLADRLKQATLSRGDVSHCALMLRDPDAFDDMLADLIVQWRIHGRP